MRCVTIYPPVRKSTQPYDCIASLLLYGSSGQWINSKTQNKDAMQDKVSDAFIHWTELTNLTILTAAGHR